MFAHPRCSIKWFSAALLGAPVLPRSTAFVWRSSSPAGISENKIARAKLRRESTSRTGRISGCASFLEFVRPWSGARLRSGEGIVREIINRVNRFDESDLHFHYECFTLPAMNVRRRPGKNVREKRKRDQDDE